MPESAIQSVVYVSRETTPFDPLKLTGLQEQSSRKNARVGVTGYLCYDRKRFVQCIEGQPEVVEELFQTIHSDERHEVLAWDSAVSPEGRRFPDWGMKWVTTADLLEISMEHLLTDHLLLLERVRDSDQTWRRLIWQMVGRLAEQQGRLKASATQRDATAAARSATRE